MPSLDQALAQAGLLTGAAVPGWLGTVLRRIDVPGPVVADTAIPLTLALPPFTATVRLTVRVQPGKVHLDLDLTGLTLGWAGGGTSGASGAGRFRVTVATSGAGAGSVTTSVEEGSGLLKRPAAGPRFPGPGATAVVLDLDEGRIVSDAVGPGLFLKGKLRLADVPLPVGPVDFAITWRTDGLEGSVSKSVGGARYEITWNGGHDWAPDGLVVDVPVPPGLVPGAPDARGRVRFVGGRRASGGIDLRAEVLAPDDGVASSTDRTVVATAAFLIATVAATDAPVITLAEVTALAGAAAALGETLDVEGKARITRASVDLATPRQVEIDYEVALTCDADTPVVRFGTATPMRVRASRVVVDLRDGRLDWTRAAIDVVDPGDWKVTRPKGALQVDKVRSGKGSLWFELDLRFAMDLGPVEVETATLRCTFGSTGGPTFSLRGFGVRLEVPGIVDAAGRVSFDGPSESPTFSAALRAEITPLNLNAAAYVAIEQPTGRPASLVAELGVDLPAPIPLASTGLGLFGVGGIVGINKRITMTGTTIKERLDWDPRTGNVYDDGSALLGLKVAVGTLPDLGHGFGAVGNLAVSTPDLAIVAAVRAKVLGDRPSVVKGIPDTNSLKGILAVVPPDEQGNGGEVYLAVLADYSFPESTRFKLLKAFAPLEARWPRQDPASWFVHIGTDAGRSPGPVQVKVLPDIFPGAVAGSGFLMVEGDGLTGFPIPVASSGLVAAAGIDVSATLAAIPAIARIRAHGMVAVSTHPVFLSGRAGVGGSLRLGPFALGVSADLTFQLGPGDAFGAALRICGHIDLWFFEVSGCVSISLGTSPTVEVPPAPSPVSSITATDVTGNRVTTLDTDGVPLCWPDATVQIGFTPAPRVPEDITAPFFDFRSGGYEPDGELGDPAGYHADYVLDQMTVKDQDGIDVGLVPATWQSKPGQPEIPGNGAAVLALFTTDNALWTRHLADGGKSDLSAPFRARKRECNNEKLVALPGWAVGVDALRTGPESWRVPAEHVPGAPSGLRSVVRIHGVTTSWPCRDGRKYEAGPATRPMLHVGTFPQPSAVDGSTNVLTSPRPFTGWLALADLRTVTIIETSCVTRLTCDRIVTRGTLVLATRRAPMAPRSVRTGSQDWQRGEVKDLGGGLWATVWSASTPSGASIEFDAIEITHPEPLPDEMPETARRPQDVLLLGLGGITKKASDTVDKTNRKKPFTTGPPVPPTTAPTSGPRLKPGSTYSLQLHWNATAATGSSMVKHSDGWLPQPFRFRIPALQANRVPTPSQAVRETSWFHTAMLVRHLRRYRPDGTVPWFTADEVGAVLDRSAFTVAHAYGLTPRLVLARTDEPDAQPQTLAPRIEIEVAEGLTKAEVAALEAVVTPRCALPHGPLVLIGVTGGLAPDSQYDVAVTFTTSSGQEPCGVRGRLPAESFRTSHWASPAALFRDAGWGPGASTSPAVAGLTGVLPARAEVADGALADALRGVVPALDRPVRTTLLLLSGGAAGPPLVAGVLIECAESLVRGRPLDGLTLRSPGGGPTDTWSATWDRPRTAVLFVPPIARPAEPLTLSWTAWGAAQSASLSWTPAADARELLALSQGAEVVS